MTPQSGTLTESDREALRRRIPGWGADLDPALRPSIPMELDVPSTGGVHTEVIERQAELRPRERSIEYPSLTPVFGTAQPLHGVSGKIRRFSYDHLSEARATHWLLLMLGDRTEALGAWMKSMFSRRPDNPLTETGVLGEPRMRPISSRFGRGRADLRHTWIDPILVAGPWLLGGWVLVRLLRRKRR